MPIRNALTIYHAAEYIWHGLDSLTSFNVDVALLDGAAVAGALLHKQYEPASSMMFLLSISDALEDYTLQKAKSLRRSSDRGVAGHICDRIEAHGKQHRADPHSRRGKCRLDSGMPRSYYGYLYFVVHRV